MTADKAWLVCQSWLAFIVTLSGHCSVEAIIWLPSTNSRGVGILPMRNLSLFTPLRLLPLSQTFHSSLFTMRSRAGFLRFRDLAPW